MISRIFRNRLALFIQIDGVKLRNRENQCAKLCFLVNPRRFRRKMLQRDAVRKLQPACKFAGVELRIPAIQVNPFYIESFSTYTIVSLQRLILKIKNVLGV
jgi:hypothetical protein